MGILLLKGPFKKSMNPLLTVDEEVWREVSQGCIPATLIDRTL
jgi:hypothetical protein